MVVGEDGLLPLPWLRGPLDEALAGQRGHALLVHAAPGIGSLEFTMALAQAWLCEAAVSPRPCGRCGGCRLVQSHTHPDLHVRLPEELALAVGWPVTVDEKRKPSRQIRIDEVRAAIDWIVTTSARGVGKVLVLHPADTMNPSAASALLKTLEEPPRGARLLLSVADPALLMPTVRSRCQVLRLPAPGRAVAREWLAGQGVADAQVLLDATADRPLDALQWHREGVTAAAWSGLPLAVSRGQASPLSGWPVRRVLDALQKICHDAMVVRAGGSPRYFPSLAGANWPGSGFGSMSALDAWRRALQQVARHADHPWSEPLLVEALVGQGQDALATSKAPGRVARG